MKNFVQDGDLVTVAAPYAVTSGGGALIGQLFGVATHTAANGASVTLALEGVFSLAKVAAQAWSVGDVIYWDDTEKKATSTAGSNVAIGLAMAAAANPSSTGVVRLNMGPQGIQGETGATGATGPQGPAGGGS